MATQDFDLEREIALLEAVAAPSDRYFAHSNAHQMAFTKYATQAKAARESGNAIQARQLNKIGKKHRAAAEALAAIAGHHVDATFSRQLKVRQTMPAKLSEAKSPPHPGHYVVYDDDGSMSSGPHKSKEEAEEVRDAHPEKEKVRVMNHQGLQRHWNMLDHLAEDTEELDELHGKGSLTKIRNHHSKEYKGYVRDADNSDKGRNARAYHFQQKERANSLKKGDKASATDHKTRAGRALDQYAEHPAEYNDQRHSTQRAYLRKHGKGHAEFDHTTMYDGRDGKTIKGGALSGKHTLKSLANEEVELNEGHKVGDRVKYVGAYTTGPRGKFKDARIYNIVKQGNLHLHQVEYHTGHGGIKHELGQGQHIGNFRRHEIKKIDEANFSTSIGKGDLHQAVRTKDGGYHIAKGRNPSGGAHFDKTLCGKKVMGTHTKELARGNICKDCHGSGNWTAEDLGVKKINEEEEKTMSIVSQLIAYAIEKKPLEFTELVHEAIRTRASEVLDEVRDDVAQSFDSLDEVSADEDEAEAANVDAPDDDETKANKGKKVKVDQKDDDPDGDAIKGDTGSS